MLLCPQTEFDTATINTFSTKNYVHVTLDYYITETTFSEKATFKCRQKFFEDLGLVVYNIYPTPGLFKSTYLWNIFRATKPGFPWGPSWALEQERELISDSFHLPERGPEVFQMVDLQGIK